MPSYYLMSLFQRQKEKYCRRYAKAQQELEDFMASVEAREVAGVFRAYVADVPWWCAGPATFGGRILGDW